MNTGDEYDALTPWKKFIRWKTGQRHRIKKRYNRRERMESKSVLRRIALQNDLPIEKAEKRLTHNRCQCNVCKDIIESKHVHDFVQCSCGRIFTDGGTEYVRRGCESPSDIVDLTEYESNAEALIRVDKETCNIESGRF